MYDNFGFICIMNRAVDVFRIQSTPAHRQVANYFRSNLPLIPKSILPVIISVVVFILPVHHLNQNGGFSPVLLK